MAKKHANFICFIVIDDEESFCSLCILSFTLKLDSFDERNLLI